MEIAEHVSASPALKNWFLAHDDESIWQALTHGEHTQLYQLLNRYIDDFGERCVGELKLETVSFVQYPPALVKVVRAYVEAGITKKQNQSNTEEMLRQQAEKEVNRVLKNKWLKKWRFGRKLKQARTLVSNRENLRYERTRAFGIVRQLFYAMGQRFYAEGLVEHARDIFYLTKEEIFAFISGTAVSQDIKGTITQRKKEYAGYEQMATPAERLETYGMVYQGNDFYNRSKIILSEGDLKGIGCCPGLVKARVTVVAHPQEISTLNGSILVTTSTDPGWVTLFPSAAGIVVERGSLLSHSAIVAREMGIPCIVGVTGLLQRLKTGDTVIMNGSTGEISIIK
jgi:pyruvate,water dikinase